MTSSGPQSSGRPVAVTGAGGRLGRAVVDGLRGRGQLTVPWVRPDYNLDDPSAAYRVISRDKPRLVIHCAAWTDVDGCSRDPRTAQRRNNDATVELAVACAAAGSELVFLSTNEVFDGRRTDGRGYSEEDPTAPVNAYGQSKLGGEIGARDAFAAAGQPGPWIIRTSWLFGLPGDDFPEKIVAAADRLRPGEAVRVVDDEFGTPTYSGDLAIALLKLVEVAPPDVYHLVPSGAASRLDFAQRVIEACRPGTPIEPISRSDFRRASEPPAWGVLDASYAASFGAGLRDWHASLNAYLAGLC